MGSNINIFNFIPSTTGVVQTEFIMLVKTDNAGTSASDQFTIPTTGTGYNYDVDWGDGTTSTGVTGNITHTFPSAGNYVVKISGAFPRIYFNNGGDKLKLLDAQNWGNIAWGNMQSAFYGCLNMDVTATDAPIISTSSFSFMFRFSNISSLDASNWDVSGVSDLNYTFGYSNFNGNIDNWDVSSVTTMLGTFSFNNVFNQPLNSWDVSNAVIGTISSVNLGMFQGASSFNQPLDNWNVSHITDFGKLFSGATSFNQNLSSWDVSNAVHMTGMFYSCSPFNNGGSDGIKNWNVSNVINFGGSTSAGSAGMFSNTSFNQPIGSWTINTSASVNMGQMFYNTPFNQDISSWNVSSVVRMNQMFQNASAFNQDISSWDVSSVLYMEWMFSGATAFNQNLGSWQLDSVTDLRFIFANSGMSTANYTDTIVGWANYVFTNGAPFNVNMSTQTGRTYDTSRSGGANFATAGDARTYLTTATPTGAGWTISGDTVI